MYIINEASTSKRRYKCPYCNYRDERNKLVNHVAKKHEDLIPEGYTPARVVFNSINKKDHGVCIQCGAETPWNEQTWRYERLCGRKKCHDDYVKMVNERMMKKYNTTTLLNDPEHQKKMLANRRISGTYKFSDGGVREYCGSYERKLLEFYDKVMNVKSSEIMTPGPTIEYEYNGKKHFWITDVYYITANLVHDVKDGGSNPNTRQMDEYREKQDAKEKTIAELNKYNYIRLTDNNFRQLLLILAEIKESLMEDSDPEYKIHINEFTSTAGTLPPGNPVYVVHSYSNGSFIKDGITFSNTLEDVYEIKNGKMVKKKPDKLEEDCTIFEFLGNSDNIKEYILELYNNQKDIEFDQNYFYKLLTKKDVLSSDQILFDENFREVNNLYLESNIKRNIDKATYNIDNILNTTVLPVLEVNQVFEKDILLEEYSNLNILQDINGYFAINIHNKKRTPYYESVDKMNRLELEILNRR